MENQEQYSNFKGVQKYDRYFADTEKYGRVEYWVIDINTMRVEGSAHYVAAVRYRLKEREVKIVPLIDFNINIEKGKLVKF